MSKKTKKPGRNAPPKKAEASDREELTPDQLEGVTGGLGVAVPAVTDAASLAATETAVCISSQ